MLPEVVIFGLAFAARLIPAVIHGGFSGNYGYDGSVYYAAADGFIHGKMPYRDFIMLHPPGIMLIDSPFAWFGGHTSDHIGFVAANLFAGLVAAVNAVLVVRVARALGLPQRAALVGGLVYALWFGAIAAEYLARLEPFGNFFLLVGLLLFVKARGTEAPGRRATLLAIGSGLAFGAGVSIKLWWAVPLVVLLAWMLVVERRVRATVLTAVGAVLAGVAIDGPFLAIAGKKMWWMIVRDQLDRPVGNTSVVKPFSYLLIGRSTIGTPNGVLVLVVLIALALLGYAALRCWRRPAMRFVLVVLVAQLIQIGAEPSWFTFYADFLTVALALTVAGAVAPRPDVAPSERSIRLTVWSPVIAGLVLVALLAAGLPSKLIQPFPRAQLTAAAKPFQCVMSDSPMGLIEMNALTRSWRAGCKNWVDVTGRRYELDRILKGTPRKTIYMHFNQDMLAYLSTGDAVIFVHKPKDIGLGKTTIRDLTEGGVISPAGDYTLYRVNH